MACKPYSLPSDYMIWLDTCCFMESERMEKFLETYCDEIKKKNIKIHILPGVMSELEKHSKSDEQEKSEKSKYALSHFLNGTYPFFEIYSEGTEEFADNVFQYIFTKLRITHKLFLITQDINLGKDILDLNNTRSVVGQKIKVFKLSYEGNLEPINLNDERQTWSRINKFNDDDWDDDDWDDEDWDDDDDDDETECKIINQVNGTVNTFVNGKKMPMKVTVSKDGNKVTYSSAYSTTTISMGSTTSSKRKIVKNYNAPFLEGDVEEDLNDDFRGCINGDIIGDINSNVEGEVNGDIIGDINGSFRGRVNGDIIGDIHGTVEGQVNGDVLGDIYGQLFAKVSGEIKGNRYS